MTFSSSLGKSKDADTENQRGERKLNDAMFRHSTNDRERGKPCLGEGLRTAVANLLVFKH